MSADPGGLSLVSRDDMRRRVEHAVSTERFMTRLGWIVLVLAIVALTATVVLWPHGDVTMEQALAAIFGVIITGILSGGAAYSSGVNVGLAASRLALAMEQDEADRSAE